MLGIADFINTLSEEDHKRFFTGKADGKYYNYFLKYPDGTIFYIGKGTGKRIDAHEADARCYGLSHKCDVIREIWASGGQVIKEKIAFFDDEEEAYALEKLLIKFFGMKNLTNKAKGGQGGEGGFRQGSGRRPGFNDAEKARREAETQKSEYMSKMLAMIPMSLSMEIPCQTKGCFNTAKQGTWQIRGNVYSIRPICKACIQVKDRAEIAGGKIK